MNKSLTVDQVEHFHVQGYVKNLCVLGDAALTKVRDDFERLYG